MSEATTGVEEANASVSTMPKLSPPRDGATDEQELERPAAVAAGGPRRAQVDAVGNDPVVAAVVAPRGPGGRLGHGDPGAELAVQAPGPRDVRGEAVREQAGRVGMEGADRRRARRLDGVPADDRRVRLVDVDDVVAAG